MKLTMTKNSTGNPMVTREEARAALAAASDEMKVALLQSMPASEYAMGLKHGRDIIERHFSHLLYPKIRQVSDE